MEHKEYWINRSKSILAYVDRTDIDIFAEIQKVYASEAVEMQKELFVFVTRYADNNAMSYQEALQRLRGQDLSDYQANAKKYREQAEKDPELLKRLNEQYAASKVTRMDALGLELVYRIGSMNGMLRKSFEGYLKSTANYVYQKALGGHAGSLNEPALQELIRTPFNGADYSEQLWGNTDKLVEDVKDILKRGFVRGDDVRAMAQELATKYNVARSRAQTLIRTDGTSIINRATIRRYQDAGLKYYRVLVQLDSRTTQICRNIAKEDKRYHLDEFQVGVTAPPFHFNCRSTVIPDKEELESDKTLENLNDKEYNQSMSTLDLMAKQRSFTVGSDIRVKTKQLRGTGFDFWVQDNTKKIRDTVFNVQSILRELNDFKTPTVVFLKKSRLPGLAGYDYKQNILFISDELHSEEEFSKILSDNYFAAQNIKDALVHELTHKKHWDSAKAFYKVNKKRYNSVEQAMSELNSPLVSYVKEQLKHDYNYLYNISDNAAIAFYNDNINELVAEVGVLGDKVPDPNLLNKVKEVLSWK